MPDRVRHDGYECMNLQLKKIHNLAQSYEHSRRSNLFVAVGSSLAVTPAADMPTEALMAGAKLVILNQGQTPFDKHTYIRFYERIGDVLPRTVKRLKHLMGLFE